MILVIKLFLFLLQRRCHIPSRTVNLKQRLGGVHSYSGSTVSVCYITVPRLIRLYTLIALFLLPYTSFHVFALSI